MGLINFSPILQHRAINNWTASWLHPGCITSAHSSILWDYPRQI